MEDHHQEEEEPTPPCDPVRKKVDAICYIISIHENGKRYSSNGKMCSASLATQSKFLTKFLL